MRSHIFLGVVVLVLTEFSGLCAQGRPSARRAVGGERMPALEARLADDPPAPIVRRSIAVGSFDATGGFVAVYGGFDLGGGLAAMLADELVRSGAFTVVERAQLQGVLSEQKLRADGLLAPGAVPAYRSLTAAQLIVHGSVVRFDQQESSSGLRLGFGNGGGLLGSAGLRSTEGSIEIVLRLVDTSTAEAVETIRVTKSVSGSRFELGAAARGASLGVDSLKSTGVGQAAAAAINEGVRGLVQASASRPFLARVVEVEGTSVVINAGRVAGLRVGDQFQLTSEVAVYTDPVTGERLGGTQAMAGEATLTRLDEKYAVLTLSSGAATGTLARGDLATLKRRSADL